MSRRIPISIPAPISREDWIKHFVDHHAKMPDAPSPDDIRRNIHIFAKMLNDHNDLHVHFHVGHEHNGSLITPGRLS